MSYLTCSRCGNNDITLAGFAMPDSPMPDLMVGGGSLISMTERDAELLVKTTIFQAELCIVSLTKDIERLDVITTDLKRRLRTLTEYAAAHRNMFNPFLRLPFELISKIFILSCPPPKDNLERYRFSRAVVIPGQVCRRFREIALSTPYLWSFITVNLGKVLENRHTPVTDWLSRTSSYPLSLWFTANGGYDVRHELRLQSTLSSSSRWKHVDMSAALARRGRFRAIKAALPTLESLRLGLSNESSEGGEIIDIFTPAPRLTSLHLLAPLGPGGLIIRWDQLTELTLIGHAVKMMPVILSKCSNIVKCSASFPKEFRNVAGVPPQHFVENTSLRSLDLDFEWHEDGGILSLELPSLSDLKFSGQLSTFNILLSYSSCSLTSLQLTTSWMHGDTLVDILGLSPKLEVLGLSGDSCFGLTASVLTQLTADTNTDPGTNLPLAPKLRLLSLDQPPFNDPQGYEVLSHMVESRFRLDDDMMGLDSAYRIARIESVKVPVHVTDAYIAPETVARFCTLREEAGLEVELPYYYDGPVDT